MPPKSKIPQPPEEDILEEEDIEEEDDSPSDDDVSQDDGDQDDLADRFAERAKRARRKGAQEERSRLLRELGVTDLDELKQLKDAEDQRKREQMSQVEQLQADLQAAQERADQAEAQIAQLQRQHHEVSVQKTLHDLATEEGAKNADDVVMWINANHSTDVNELIDENGEVDHKAAAKLVDKCFKARKEWFEKATDPGSPPNNPRGGGKKAAAAKMSFVDALAEARKQGRI